MRRIYIDTCLIVGYFHPNEPNNQHKIAINFFNKISNRKDIELCLSHFSITEFTQVYVTKPNISDELSHKIANALLLTNKIDKKHSFTLLKTEGNRINYGFGDFFLDIQTVLLNTTPRPGIADAVHATIMDNNDITEIVTFNTSDFINIDKIIPSIPSIIK